MDGDNKINEAPLLRHEDETNKNDLQVILPLVIKKWYLFVIATVILIVCVQFYIRHTLPVYRTSATILINESDDRSLMGNVELLQGLGLPGGMRNLQNQIMILKSRELTENTLQDLAFEVDFYFKTIRTQLPIYPEMPLRILTDKEVPLPRDTEFSISFISNSSFIIESESKNYPFKRTSRFGDTININTGSFWLECWNEEWLNRNMTNKVYFTIHSKRFLINYFTSRIEVELVAKEGSILRISLVGTNKVKDVDFLNRHIEGFQSISLNRKNTEAQRRLQFIEDQLVGISDSLTSTETKLQQFRSTHKVMDLSAQGQSIIGQVTLLENEKARLDLEANYYDYLAEYLSKQNTDEIPIVPITMGITDAGLARLVEELTDLQGQLATRGAGEMNPLQRSLEQRVSTTKDVLRETLNGLKRANSLARSEKQDQINKANAQASALPVTERQLLGIERKFRLNDELYTFLLETRAELEMQKASNRADSEIIDRADARFSRVISPNRTKLNMMAMFGGIAIPLAFILFSILFGKRIKYEEIKNIPGLPLIGSIPHNSEKSSTVVLQNPNSSIAESFRIIRTKMQFLTKDKKSPIILITSTMPEDGKTFTAINLASAYSLLGKRTILVGFDLRKPKIFQDFGLENNKGVSTWLINQDPIDEIIQETLFNNLSIISAGPIPPNPSELTALSRTKDLLTILRQKYDYIIIDTSPIGIVSDTLHLAHLADTTLIVVRPGQTLKQNLFDMLREVNVSGIGSIGLLINDNKDDTVHYGYGEKFGYTKDKSKSKKTV